MGLLDAFTGAWTDDPEQNAAIRQGLLSAAFGAMAGRGSTLQALGQGGMMGLMGYSNSLESQQQQALRKLQTEAAQQSIKQGDQQLQFGTLQQQQLQRTLDRQQRLDALPAQFMRTPEQQALLGGGGPTVANAAKVETTAPGFDVGGYLQARFAVDPEGTIPLQAALAKETPFNKVDPKDYTPESVRIFAQTRNFGDLVPARKMELNNGVAYDPYRVQPGQVVGQDPNKPFMIGPNGQLVPNTAYQQFEIQKAGAGATRVNVPVNTVKTLTQTTAEGLGKQLDDSLASANAAVQTIGTAQTLRKLLEGGKVITGPGADARMTMRQVAQGLGVGGANDGEVLANTRQAIQGLAQMELQAASAMKGHGQITEGERAILRNAAAGQINMSAPELIRLTQTLEKTARNRIQLHQQQTQRLRAIPGAESLVPFYSIDMPAGGATAPVQGGGNVVDFGSLK